MPRRNAEFGWFRLFKTLRPRRLQLVTVVGLTACVYAAGLTLPVGTQMAIDSITKGQADLWLILLFLALAVSIGIETLALRFSNVFLDPASTRYASVAANSRQPLARNSHAGHFPQP